MRVIDKDVSTPKAHIYQWRSKEVEHQLLLEASAVSEAAQHAQYGQLASLKKTLGICIVALAAAGAMVAVGMLTQDATPRPERSVLVANAPVARVAEETSSQVPAAKRPNLDFAELAVLDDSETAPAEPNRASCQAISGAAYQSESERIWFLANCVEPEPVVAFLAAPQLSGVVSQRAITTVSGPAGVSEDEAIASSVVWITHQPDAAYDVASGSCSATEVGELWLVSCERQLTGCGDEVCFSWISVCVKDVDGAVVASRNC